MPLPDLGTMDMRRLVGRNFARIRRSKGLAQEEVAELSGFTQQYLSGLEQGRRNPTVVTVYELACALNVGYLDLLVEEPTHPRLTKTGEGTG